MSALLFVCGIVGLMLILSLIGLIIALEAKSSELISWGFLMSFGGLLVVIITIWRYWIYVAR